MASKHKCGFCKGFFDKETMINRGPQSFCSEDCFNLTVRKRRQTRNKGLERSKENKLKKATRKRSDIPAVVRQEVYDRDQTCRFCGTKNNLHIHHIRYRSEGGGHDPKNLILLCHKHHDTVHSDKNRFQVLCLGVVEQMYEGERLTVPQFERMIANGN
jgi:hypothetical protein